MTTQAEMERAIRAGRKAGATRVLFDGGRIVFDLSKDAVMGNPITETQPNHWNVDYDHEETEICGSNKAA